MLGFHPDLNEANERHPDNEDIEEGTVEYLKGTLGLTQVGYRDWITVRAPKNDAVGFFGLPPDGRVPVFEIFRTAFDQNGKPMRVTVTIFPADRQQFIIDVGKVPAAQFRPPKRRLLGSDQLVTLYESAWPGTFTVFRVAVHA